MRCIIKDVDQLVAFSLLLHMALKICTQTCSRRSLQTHLSGTIVTLRSEITQTSPLTLLRRFGVFNIYNKLLLHFILFDSGVSFDATFNFEPCDPKDPHIHVQFTGASFPLWGFDIGEGQFIRWIIKGGGRLDTQLIYC